MACPIPPVERAADGVCTGMRIRKLARRVSQIYDEALAPTGLSVGQFGLLGHVVHGPARSVSELAERLMMDRSSLSRALGPLVRAGLVELASRPGDARVKAAQATDAGRAAFAAAEPAWLQAQQRVAAALGAERRAQLHAIMDDTLERL
jgi:DNA-binding MarR family transcriptional regulator